MKLFAREAGARFIVSPGLTESLSRKALASGIPFLPGIATAGDIMRGLDIGLSRFKFFPAIAAGGIPALRALSSPFPRCRFCPSAASRRRTPRSGSRSTRFRAWEEAGLSREAPPIEPRSLQSACEENNGHDADVTGCLLMTRGGHDANSRGTKGGKPQGLPPLG